MYRCGDILTADLGLPDDSEAGFQRPVVIVTAQAVLDHGPRVVHVVPLTTTIRAYRSEITITPDADNGLETSSAAQCQHVRAIAAGRLTNLRGNVGPHVLAQIREALADLFDLYGRSPR